MYSESGHPTDQSHDKRHGDSPNLDLLRSCAVLFVVFFHVLYNYQTTPWGLWSIGRWGVLIFFVHTSLVLMYSLHRHGGASFGDKYRDFLIRRCFRIYPLSIATVLIAFLLAIPAAPIVGGHFASIPIDAEALISNLLLVQDLTGSPSVIPTLWSLPYEMQMYLILPILFFAANGKSGIYRLLGCLALAALVGAMLPQAQWHGWKMPTFIPCFLAGVISYRLSLSQRPVLPGWMWPLFIAAITLLYMARPGIRAGWVCCLLLGIGIPFFAELRNGRLPRICHVVAKYSYGIYLMHFICLWISFCVLAAEPEWFHLTLFFLLVALTSVVAYHVVERPFIKFGRLLTARQPARRATALAPVQAEIARVESAGGASVDLRQSAEIATP